MMNQGSYRLFYLRLSASICGFKFFRMVVIPLTLISLLLPSCSPVTSALDPVKSLEPRLTFEEQVYNFGIAGPEEKIRHTFQFTNTGAVPLKITRVSTDCGCTAALISATDIPPGGSGEIRAVFETKRYKGKQEKTITVYSNDPYEPEIKLVIRGIVKTEVAVDPQGLNFGDVQKGEIFTKTVRLLQLSQNNLMLKKIEANDNYFAVAASRFREENSRGINIDVTLKPDVPVGQFREVITLHTNLKRRPRIDVPIWANILGMIKTEPSIVSFGIIKKGMEGSAEARIFRHDGEEFGIVRAESNLPYLTVEVKELVRRKEYGLIVHVQKNSPAGRMAGEIRIFTDYPEEAMVKLPCFALIEK